MRTYKCGNKKCGVVWDTVARPFEWCYRCNANGVLMPAEYREAYLIAKTQLPVISIDEILDLERDLPTWKGEYQNEKAA